MLVWAVLEGYGTTLEMGGLKSRRIRLRMDAEEAQRLQADVINREDQGVYVITDGRIIEKIKICPREIKSIKIELLPGV